jgi:leucyl/phenylalanyl-tRNA--protein transferase
MASLQLTWLETDSPFPEVAQALAEPAGLLAAGADLSIPRLRSAYTQGIFPWFSQDEPPLWWSPDPRMVLKCDALHLSHSLTKRLRQIAKAQQAGNFDVVVKVDTAFAAVLRGCARPAQGGQPGTWITEEMQLAYQAWHLVGQVHSIETWINDELVGGLYGVSIGKMFFGESMFSHSTDASKIALAHLVWFLKRQQVAWIDCQMQTSHLASMGASAVPREQFLAHVQRYTAEPDIAWASGWLDREGVLHPQVRASR